MLQCHVQDGELKYVESDNTGDASFGAVEARACLRGRSIRPWLGSADRLNYPMKRVEGTKRGDGQYERISWDEALDTIASEFKRITEKYGNESVFIQECSGVEQNIMMNNPFFRLFNLLGGEITRYGSYSSASISFGAYPYVYGSSWGNRSFKTLQDGELVVMFGFAPNDMRMAGDGPGYDLAVAREKKNVRIINIDPRRTETCANLGAEWIPIVPGTDAALVAALAHELIENDLVNLDFLHTYVVGFDEESMPEDARGKHLSYRDYIMGTGYDQVEKTPAWAASITKIPAERIASLAREIGEAKPCVICQGLGMQRHANGDNASRAVMALALMVGQVGRPGTTAGGTIGNDSIGLPTLPTGKNPVKTQIPQYLWPEAIRDGEKLTATHDGVKGADALKTGIKFLVNYGNNMMANQNGDINTTTDILRDESLCEFILQYDVAWTDSCNWADIVLPDLTPQETYSLTGAGEACDVAGVRFGQPVYEPKFERRESTRCAASWRAPGRVRRVLRGGLTREDWCRKLYDELARTGPTCPPTTRAWMGTFTYDIEPSSENDPFIGSGGQPAETTTGKARSTPLRSPSSPRRGRSERRRHHPLPSTPGPRQPDDVTEEYPFQILDFHHKCTTHSTYAPTGGAEDPRSKRGSIPGCRAPGIADLDQCGSTAQGRCTRRR